MTQDWKIFEQRSKCVSKCIYVFEVVVQGIKDGRQWLGLENTGRKRCD